MAVRSRVRSISFSRVPVSSAVARTMNAVLPGRSSPALRATSDSIVSSPSGLTRASSSRTNARWRSPAPGGTKTVCFPCATRRTRSPRPR